MLEYCLARGYRVDFLAFTEGDHKFISANFSGEEANGVSIIKCYNFDTELFSKAFNYRFFISQRLHGCIISASYAVPCISLAYDKKCENFMNSIGLSRFVVTNQDRSEETLIDHILDIEHNYSRLQRSLRAQTKTQLAAQSEAFSALRKEICET
jgi:polysaccharide pyruvyl transferase WcaK-like protein